ncbi:FkbM family methyltransferase [Flavobacterium sp. 103]|uniref:FkbM family methyltransferase n=1 Tax=Flavobacterium sp. 103 TaxID=2135624 RepID=UPI000D5F6A4A|nr:FkbM family methyltransferase [Flavobacterium sp. 103]PVX46608.1 FkbM family methyltransferase [Flavobacterium sp. 103]
MSDFKKALDKKIIHSLKNNYGIENYDEYRFGKYPVSNNDAIPVKVKKPINLSKELKKAVKKIIGYDPYVNIYLANAHNLMAPYADHIKKIWNNISTNDRELLVSLIAYKILGYKKVKLPRNNSSYWEAIKTAKTLSNPKDTYDPHFMHFILEKFDLKPIGFDVNFYFSEIGIAIDYIIEQYTYKVNNKSIVAVESGDTVLDIGGCWGDTALYFASKTGENGKVYSFEFIPDNIKLFKINTSLNPILESQIELVPNPVSNISNQTIYFKDYGPGSRVEFEPFEAQTGTAATISIDDFVKSNTINAIDFIKMDIEGAESLALEGTLETIKRFRPKLAIAIYHSMDDFFNIPYWILNLDLDYEIFIGHYTIHAEETICFAKPRNKA